MENSENTKIEIPDFTVDDYLKTSVPFSWIVIQTKGDKFKQKQLVEQVAMAARELHITNFKTMFQDYIKSLRGQDIVYENVMEFSGTSLMLGTGEWHATDYGVYRDTGFGPQYACSHPIFILSRYSNVDTGAESVEIVYGRYGREYKHLIVPRSDIASANRILKLAEYGISVTSENAKCLVQYLNDFENINYEKINEKNSCDHMGWVGNGYKRFAPYIDDLTFEGQDSYKFLFNSVAAVGNYDKWLSCIRAYRKDGSPIVRIVMAAALASVLLKPLGALPFFVHLWGDTEVGKSVALLAAVSIWANPVIGRYAYTFNSTDVGNELYTACLNSLPLCMDELQILNKRSDFDDIIYRLCEGTGRLRGRKEGGIQNIKTWRNCIITTGERPITSMSSGGGAVNRVIEVECNYGKFFNNPREFCNVIQANYGHAGRIFVEGLTDDGGKGIKEARILHEQYIKLLEDSSDATDKQISSAAAILVADELAERWIYRDNIRLSVDDIKPYLQTKDMLNVNKRGYEYMREEIIANHANFVNDDKERWGVIKDGYVYILRNRFNAILSEGGFNPQSTLSWMARNGKLAKTDGNHLAVKSQINGTRTRCICLYEDDGEYTDVEDDDLPF